MDPLPIEGETQMTTLIDHLSLETPITLNALMKASGLTQTGLTLALVELGGKVAVRDGGVVLATPAAAPATPATPVDRPLMVGFVGRRPAAIRRDEIARCRSLILAAVEVGEASGPTLHRSVGFAVDYRNIHKAARDLIQEGLIREEKRGRLRVWVGGDRDLVAMANGDFGEVLGE